MQITLEIPDDISPASLLSEADWLREIAITLFQQELITLGRASKIAGMHLIEFQQLIASRGICIHYDVEEFEQDIQHLRDRGWL
jgi:predicted HTH domain antitoxin